MKQSLYLRHTLLIFVADSSYGRQHRAGEIRQVIHDRRYILEWCNARTWHEAVSRLPLPLSSLLRPLLGSASIHFTLYPASCITETARDLGRVNNWLVRLTEDLCLHSVNTHITNVSRLVGDFAKGNVRDISTRAASDDYFGHSHATSELCTGADVANVSRAAHSQAVLQCKNRRNEGSIPVQFQQRLRGF